MENDQKPYHIPVLLDEVVQYMHQKPKGTYVDVTFGGGGHTKALLQAQPDCKVIALDWDSVALEKNGQSLQEIYPDRLTLVWGNFAQVDRHLKKIGIDAVDGILADFGTSQYQISERAGFSFSKDSPLDMRMSPSQQKTTAAEVINKATEQTLCDIFTFLGQEKKARAIARAIVHERTRVSIISTKQLADLVENVVGGRGAKRIHPATQVFQALRMYVNKETENIHAFLVNATRTLKPGGRLLCISFHSLEDRAVKQFFKEREQLGDLIITPKVVIPTDQEIARNPASRSAKLRVLERQAT
ncbi:MAG: Ribosomal RNA small subunit methyltransferase H [Candidatus Dependentiae bacterium ADurb.Bin331]|nr:MAG: Ribosomal RNA small subunit methyltransferase H [Candidatus Dependentiae bacterium ADurb.Bin331]